MNSRRGLEIAEYIVLILTVLGLLAAVMWGNIIYVAVAVVGCVLFNLVSRYQIYRQMQRSNHVASSIESRIAVLSSEISSLRSVILDLPQQLNNSSSVKSEDDLQPSVAPDIVQLKEQCANVQDLLSDLIYKMLSDGQLSGYNLSENADSQINKIIDRYNEGKRERSKQYADME